MNRIELIEKIKEYCMPLGPFVDIFIEDDGSAYEEFIINRYSVFKEESVDCLIDMLVNLPKEDEILPIDITDFGDELADILIFMGNNYDINLLNRLQERIKNCDSIELMIDVIGSLKDEKAVNVLEELMDEDLSHYELIYLADTFCTIRTDLAKSKIEKMKIKYKDSSREVLEEIDICLSYFN